MPNWREEFLVWVVAPLLTTALEYCLFRWQKTFVLTPADGDAPEVIPRWWNPVAASGGLVVGGVVGTCLYWLCGQLNTKWAMSAGVPIYALLPEPGLWFAYALFAGLFSAAEGASLVMRLVLGPGGHRDWRASYNKLQGYAALRFMRVLALAVMIPFTVFLIPALFCHSRFDAESFAYHGYGAPASRVVKYCEVKAVVEVEGGIAPIGTFVKRPHLVLELNGGRLWTSELGVRDHTGVPPGLAEFVAEKSGREIRRQRLYP